MWIGLRSQSHLRFGFDSDSRLSTFLFRSSPQAPTGRKEPVARSRCRSHKYYVVVYSIPIICVVVVVVCIHYFSPKSGICHKTLDFYEDSFEDSTSIKERLCEVMDKSRLPWSRVTAYGADNTRLLIWSQ
ncbi:hypothetical protein TNCV_4536641 [Trichonephila clavipes]|nr:hypothetical protein TNCV_4536641 [Trichonephila clavipes]